MGDIDILVRELYDIPEDEDTLEFCEKYDIDYEHAVHFVIMKGATKHD